MSAELPRPRPKALPITKIEQFIGSLNPEQQKAIAADAKAVRLLAGPGSGKTRVIVAKVLHLLSSGVPPHEIMAVTFTNKAASETKARLMTVLDTNTVQRITAGTFHGICVAILKRYIHYLPNWDQNFAIYDEDDRIDTLKRLLTDKHKYQPKQAAKKAEDLSNTMSLMCSLIPYAASRSGQQLVEAGEQLAPVKRKLPFARSDLALLAKVYDQYQAKLAEEKALDFDNLLVVTIRLLREQPLVLDHLHQRYRHLLVDEFQDTNRPQYELVQLLMSREVRLVVVGDVNQAIYRWRGACPDNMEARLDGDFGRSLSTILLTRNYRSHPAILEVADTILRSGFGTQPSRVPIHPVRGPPADLRPSVRLTKHMDPFSEARHVAGRIQELHKRGVKYSDMLVLYRTHTLTRSLEQVLPEAGVPYAVLSGPSFWALKEVRATLHYLRLALRPGDELALRRVLKHMSRGLGDKTVSKLNALAAERGLNLAQLLMEGCEGTQLPEAVTADIIQRLAEGKGMEALLGVAPPISKDVASAVKLTKKMAAGLGEIRDLAVMLRNVATWHSPGTTVRALRQAFYDDYIKAGGEDVQGAEDRRGTRLKNLDDVEARGRMFIQQPDVGEVPAPASPPPQQGQEPRGLEALELLLSTAMLETNADNTQVQDRVKLMTIHSAKGLEAKAVFLLGVEDNRLPLRRGDELDLEDYREELNLAYVAVTRAEDELNISWVVMPRNDRPFQKGFSQLSPFFKQVERGAIEGVEVKDCTRRW